MNPRLLASFQEKIAWFIQLLVVPVFLGQSTRSTYRWGRSLRAVLPGQGQSWEQHWLGLVAACLQLSSPVSEHSNDSSLFSPFLLPSFSFLISLPFHFLPSFFCQHALKNQMGKGYKILSANDNKIQCANT